LARVPVIIETRQRHSGFFLEVGHHAFDLPVHLGAGGLPDLLVLDSIGLVIPRQIKNIIKVCQS